MTEFTTTPEQQDQKIVLTLSVAVGWAFISSLTRALERPGPQILSDIFHGVDDLHPTAFFFDNDGSTTSEFAPSESPDRKRIVCVFLISRTFERECVMKIEGTPDNLNDAGAGEGPLADALQEALTRSYWNRLLEFG